MFQPLKEGYRAWAAGFGVPKSVTGKKADAVYEFINWFLDGWAGAYLNRQGYYSAVLETAKAKMEAYEWAYWMEGKAAAHHGRQEGRSRLRVHQLVPRRLGRRVPQSAGLLLGGAGNREGQDGAL